MWDSAIWHVNGYVCVDPLLTVDTARRFPRIDNLDDKHTSMTGQHWTDVKPCVDNTNYGHTATDGQHT